MVLCRKYNVDPSDDTYLGSPLEITLADLETLRDDATTMAAEMTDLAARLLRAFLGDTDTPIVDYGTKLAVERRAGLAVDSAGSPLVTTNSAA